jgi:transposase
MKSRLGTSRGGLSTKLHLRTDGHGRPLVILATPGQRHEITQLEALLDGGVERSVGRLKQFRRVATRYDKRAVNYVAWVTLAIAVIWL